MKSGARQHDSIDESGRQRPELCRIGRPERWVGAKGRHQAMVESQIFEAREISGNEGSHLPEMLVFFISIISPNFFDLYLLSHDSSLDIFLLDSIWPRFSIICLCF